MTLSLGTKDNHIKISDDNILKTHLTHLNITLLFTLYDSVASSQKQ